MIHWLQRAWFGWAIAACALGAAAEPTGKERLARNAFAFGAVAESEGLYALTERTGGSAVASGVIGLAVADGDGLRLMVTWRIGLGRRATCAAILKRVESETTAYSSIDYAGGETSGLAYDLEAYGPGLGHWPWRGTSDRERRIDAFTLESDGFVDLWTRVR